MAASLRRQKEGRRRADSDDREYGGMTSGDRCIKMCLLSCFRDRVCEGFLKGAPLKGKLVTATSEWEKLIGYDTAPNYHAGRKPPWEMCAELYRFAETSVQGHFSVKTSLCVQGYTPVRGRDIDVPLKKGVSHFVPTSERPPVSEEYHHNTRVPQQRLSAAKLVESHDSRRAYTMCREMWVKRGDSPAPWNKAMVRHLK